MNTFKVTFTDGTSYATSASGTLEEFTAYLMQDGGVFTDENPVTSEETRRTIAKIEQVLQSVDLIASGYEWICPDPECETFNREFEARSTVQCESCRAVYQVDEVHHAYK